MAVTQETKLMLTSRIAFLSLSIHVAVVLSRLWSREGEASDGHSFFRYIFDAFVACFLLCVWYISQAAAKLRPSNYNTFARSFLGCFMFKCFLLVGWWHNRKLEAASKAVRTAQETWLVKFLQNRKGTVFGKDHEYGNIKSVEDFRAKIPVTGYDFYREYAERVADGEENVLDPSKTKYIILTSGTTVKNEKSGLRMGALSGVNESMDPGYCTPFYALKEIKSEPIVMYIHAVFGLLHDDTEVLMLNFVSLARSFFVTLENRWREIVEDVRTGTLNPDLDITPEMRTKLEKDMWANPKRAAELQKEFSKGFQNIVPRVWPQIRRINMIASGALHTPSQTLKKKYFDDVPVWDQLHGASEGYYGICLDPGVVTPTRYTMLPTFAFYEFIPLKDMEVPDPKPKLMHELEQDEQYELCMTTSRGICRYRTGDIIKVVSCYNQIPVYEFIGRYGQILNICGEKTSENTFNAALEDTMSKLKDFSLVDYTTAENRSLDAIKQDISGNERYYILFIELEQKNPEVSLLTDEQKDMFDEDMQVYNQNYRELREDGRIQKMMVIQTVTGSFSILKKHILASNLKTSSVQFKGPRVLKKEVDLNLMLGQAVQPGKDIKE